jgi:hypothetical protein
VALRFVFGFSKKRSAGKGLGRDLEGKGLGRGPTRHAETHVLARVRRRGNGGEERHVFHLHHQEQKALIMKLLKLVIPTTASHTLFVWHKIKP